MILGVSGAIAALGDTLFPSRSLAEGLARDFDPAASIFVRLRILHPVIAAFAAAWLLFYAVTTARTAARPAPARLDAARHGRRTNHRRDRQPAAQRSRVDADGPPAAGRRSVDLAGTFVRGNPGVGRAFWPISPCDRFLWILFSRPPPSLRRSRRLPKKPPPAKPPETFQSAMEKQRAAMAIQREAVRKQSQMAAQWQAALPGLEVPARGLRPHRRSGTYSADRRRGQARTRWSPNCFAA